MISCYHLQSSAKLKRLEGIVLKDANAHNCSIMPLYHHPWGYGAQVPAGWIYRVPTRHIHYLSASFVSLHLPHPHLHPRSHLSHKIAPLQPHSDILAPSFADNAVATSRQN